LRSTATSFAVPTLALLAERTPWNSRLNLDDPMMNVTLSATKPTPFSDSTNVPP